MVLYAQSTTKDYIRAEGDFVKRYITERTNKAEIRPEEQSEKAESCRENLWNNVQLKGHKDRVRKRRVVGRIYGTMYS